MLSIRNTLRLAELKKKRQIAIRLLTSVGESGRKWGIRKAKWELKTHSIWMSC